MSPNEIDRKLAVIFVADVVGYSKHMENDENATLKAYGKCETILNKLLKNIKDLYLILLVTLSLLSFKVLLTL